MCPDMWQEIWDTYYDEDEEPKKIPVEIDNDTCLFCSVPLILCDCLDD